MNKISDENSFAWQKNLKFDWKDPECNINIAGWNTVYGFEYIGNIVRLVITPLTDRLLYHSHAGPEAGYGRRPCWTSRNWKD